MILLAGPFPAWTLFLLVPLGGALWGVIFCLLAIPFRFFRPTRRPWMAVGIPAVAYVGVVIYAERDKLPWRDPFTPVYFAVEGWIRGLLVFAFGISLAIWFYKRRDARSKAPTVSASRR